MLTTSIGRTRRTIRRCLLFFLVPVVTDLPSNAFAQVEWQVDGIVVSRYSGLPVHGAQVFVRGKPVAAVTDSRGRFSVKVTDRVVLLVVSHPSFVKETHEVALNSFHPSLLTLALDTIVQRRNRFVGSGSILRNTGGASLIEDIPEMEIERTLVPHLAEFFRLRLPGLGDGTISIYVNNIQRDPTITYRMSAYDVERIQVWRTTTSAANVRRERGAGGQRIIHIITRADSPDY